MSDDQRALLETFVVVRAQTGDERAFDELYERYGDRVLYYLRRLLGAAGMAEDASQTVWLKVYGKVKTLEQPAAFRTWLYRIAHNQAMSSLRRSGREVAFDEVADAGVIDPATEHDAFDDIDAAAIHAGLDRISAPHREALTLRFLHDMSYEEIADVTGVGLGTVRSRLHRAKHELRGELESKPAKPAKGARR